MENEDRDGMVLHGFTAVAELKPRREAARRVGIGEVLHGFTAVAELKRN